MCQKRGIILQVKVEAALEPSKMQVEYLEKLKSIVKERITPFQ